MVDAAAVKIWGELVGAVRWDDQQKLGYFEYHPNFVKKGWELSPITMPITNGARVYSFPELRSPRNADDCFKGLPGLLSDALPDRYGNALINSWLSKMGRNSNSMNPVEKLCFIGTRAMGALEFEPNTLNQTTKASSIEIDSLVKTAKRILEEREQFSSALSQDDEQSMMDVLRIGTSAGGARPKAVISFNPKTKEIRSGQSKTPKGFDHWLLKLDGVSGAQFGESSGWGRVEFAYYLMAKDCGIDICESQLLEENGRAHFMTRRYDRDGNTKHHVQSFCGLRHFDFNDMQSYSYEQLFETMRMLRLSYPEAEQMFRRMVFNVLSINFDDHTKNFSFMLKKDAKWQLAPAYDLCFSYDANNFWVNQQTLSINGDREGIGREHFKKIAKENSIKKADEIIDQVLASLKKWESYAEAAKLREDLYSRIKSKLRISI